jgi:phosphomannomutase
VGPIGRLRQALRPIGAVAGLAGAAALLNRGLRSRVSLARDHVGGVRRRWTWRGHEIFVTELGNGPGLLLVHGLYAGASSYEYRLLAPLLARRFRVVAFDLIGCGLSDMPELDYSAELFVEQIVDAATALCERPVTLVGSSLGAAFAIRAATRIPERIARLVAITPAGLGGVLDADPSTGQRTLGALIRAPLAGETLFNALASKLSLARLLRSRVYADPNAVTPDVVDHYYALTHQPGARLVPARYVGGALNCNVARDLPFVEAPLLIVWGEDASRVNPIDNAQRYLQLAKRARLVRVAGAGLLPQEEDAHATASAIEAFAVDGGEGVDQDRNARSMSVALSPAIFKSYDIRGIYPEELNEDVAYGIGRAFVEQLNLARIVVGRDMRPSGESLFAALARGANDSGADVTDIDLVSTDALYFAVGKFDFGGGIMITASHNPANYNGMKLTREEAQAIALDTGLAAIRDQVQSGRFATAPRRGSIERKEILPDFARHCLSFVESGAIKPFRIAIDAGNGMAGRTVPHVFKHLPCEVIPLFFELDGTFPNHPASPIEPENMVDLQAAVVEHGCDLGAAFDGDADRMFIVDEKGGLVGGDMVTALVGLNTLKRNPGAKILYNLICSRSVPEAIERAGGIPVRSQVGHSLIKKTMREENIVFGGEHSGHFYFRDNWFADSGMIALLQCLEVFSDANKPVSEVVAPINTRFRSGEINSHVRDIPSKLRELAERYKDAQIDYLDGITIQYPHWWMNVRPSNTEPLLRLNVEGDTKELMERERDRALTLIRA